MVASITDILNLWAEIGVFSYVIPFLLIFAVVFAILKKTNIFKDNNAINAIIAIAIGLLALLNDQVPIFFEVLFPRFGIGLSIFLVLIILLGFFYPSAKLEKLQWIGWVTGIGVVVWALTSWDSWGGYYGSYGIGSWLYDYFWSLIILGAIITVIILVTKSGRNNSPPTSGG
jgi:hypothetical protein